MSNGLTWTNDTRRLGDLVPWLDNPRKIADAEAERLKESREQFDQPQVIAIGPNNELYDGHQRLKAWGEEWGPELEVAVRVSSRPLTEQERRRLTVLLHRGTVGEWDFETLKDWNVGELLEWGFKPYELGLEAQKVDYEELWKGMPEFEQKDAGPIRTIKVHFESEDDVIDFARLIGQKVTDKTKFIWHPEKRPMNLTEYTCEDES